MDHPPVTPPMPADYYRRHAARVRRLASEATTPAVKEHLQDVATQYENLAEHVEGFGGSADDDVADRGGR